MSAGSISTSHPHSASAPPKSHTPGMLAIHLQDELTRACGGEHKTFMECLKKNDGDPEKCARELRARNLCAVEKVPVFKLAAHDCGTQLAYFHECLRAAHAKSAYLRGEPMDHGVSADAKPRTVLPPRAGAGVTHPGDALTTSECGARARELAACLKVKVVQSEPAGAVHRTNLHEIIRQTDFSALDMGEDHQARVSRVHAATRDLPETKMDKVPRGVAVPGMGEEDKPRKGGGSGSFTSNWWPGPSSASSGRV